MRGNATGTYIRTIGKSTGAVCQPKRWWDATTVTAACTKSGAYLVQDVYRVPLSGASATAAAPTGTTDVAPAPTTLTVDGKQVRGWPSGVYFPEGTELAYSNTDDAGGIISITSPEPEVVIGHLRDHLGAVGLPIGPDDGTVFHFDGAGWSGIVTQSEATTTVNWSVAR